MASQTAQDVITGALRRLNLISEVETMSAAQASAGLISLNEMMHGFNRKGIAYAHADLGLTDTVNMPDDLIDSLKWVLARKLADDGYGAVLSMQQMAQMVAAFNTLQSAYFMVRRSPVDSAIRARGSGGFNFTRGN